MKLFGTRHPAILLLYYSLLHVILLVSMHPFVIATALLGAISYLMCLTSFRYVLKELGFYSFVILLITIMYASSAHNGVTPLFFYNDHAVTKEAIVRGVMFGLTFTTIAFWLKAYINTMQTNHFLFLFTKIHPKLGLFTSMCFRFFPYLQELWQQNNSGMKGMHYFYTSSRFDRLGRLLLLQIHTFTQAIDTIFWKPSIMHSKGYQKQRTQFQLFTWRLTDTMFLVFLLCLTTVFIRLLSWSFDYFPAMQDVTLSPLVLSSLCIFYGLPTMIEGKELLKWHYLQSKI